MGLLDSFGIGSKGGATGGDALGAYDEVVRGVPQGTLAEGLSHTFNSDQTPPFEHMVSGLFGQSNPDQKAGLLNQVLGSLGPGTAAQILGSLGLGSLAGAAASGGLTPQQAQQVSPEAVQTIAQQAAKKDPTIVEKAAGFYAQHPTLVKAIGAGALALLMSKISAGRR
ncbi:MAG: hypothetical protein M3167_15595 [Acidobacteriota bacterium]|nr:hypothetical protein [Acidobacteriota bacterium]